jgi:hypothetical protein
MRKEQAFGIAVVLGGIAGVLLFNILVNICF